MGIIQSIKRWWEALWQKEAQDKFGVETIESDVMKAALNEWVNIYQGKPDWIIKDSDIEGYNFAKTLCNRTAWLSTLMLKITVDGSERAEAINKLMGGYVHQMKNDKCEKACAFGYIVLKPNGKSIDYVMPWDFEPTHETDGKIDGGIFHDHHHEPGDKWYYMRLEYHRFEDWRVPQDNDVRLYRITNKTYKSTGANGIGQECNIKETVWADYEEDMAFTGVERPLFSIFKMPIANNIDLQSPLGVSVFSNAIRELEGLDIAWTRLDDETYDSQHITFLGDSLIEEPGTPVRKRRSSGGIVDKIGRALPRRVRILPGSTTGDEYHEETPSLQTADRIAEINHRLDMVGVKCGYSPGWFVLDGRTGRITATQVEADNQETIDYIKHIRDAFKVATDGLIYAIGFYLDMDNPNDTRTVYLPEEEYKELEAAGEDMKYYYTAHYALQDITYNFDEDRLRHWQYVQAGKYPLWMYYVKFEGMSEDEAKAVAAEAKSENETQERLFGEE